MVNFGKFFKVLILSINQFTPYWLLSINKWLCCL